MLVRNLILSLALLSAGTSAYSACADIQKKCHDDYILDLQSCDKNYSGEQRAACVKRAEQQLSYCYEKCK